MAGDRQRALDLARNNILALQPEQYDYITSLCPSCLSHIKLGYPLSSGMTLLSPRELDAYQTSS